MTEDIHTQNHFENGYDKKLLFVDFKFVTDFYFFIIFTPSLSIRIYILIILLSSKQ